MDQLAETQVPASQGQVRVLTELVQQLLRERDSKQEPEDPYVSKSIPITGLSLHPELTEALPSIEENFFRTPLAEEERKIAIHFCTKISSTNNNPPPLNHTASSAVKKTDSAF
ncbi:hypothetical protein AYI69_g382 [Smittium culicis]|uniref:Uncharacterized protein n=1 Tax=Smittium culicis TaxID=133412 RepID=A0A1R1YT73_9FUNG|nr:hypothetical protein AYI69_g382 [Smittium culicis]